MPDRVNPLDFVGASAPSMLQGHARLAATMSPLGVSDRCHKSGFDRLLAPAHLVDGFCVDARTWSSPKAGASCAPWLHWFPLEFQRQLVLSPCGVNAHLTMVLPRVEATCVRWSEHMPEGRRSVRQMPVALPACLAACSLCRWARSHFASLIHPLRGDVASRMEGSFSDPTCAFLPVAPKCSARSRAGLFAFIALLTAWMAAADQSLTPINSFQPGGRRVLFDAGSCCSAALRSFRLCSLAGSWPADRLAALLCRTADILGLRLSHRLPFCCILAMSWCCEQLHRFASLLLPVR